MHRPLRLTLDRAALKHNWHWLEDRAGVPAGAAIKADGYGIGARETMRTLYDAGCRTFFVSTYAEAEDLGPVPGDSSLVVLHGVGADDADTAVQSTARPVLNSIEQVARWKQIAPDRRCDVMIDTGMNRLGLEPEDVGCVEGLSIATLHSHLACADEPSDMNALQLKRFSELKAAIPAERYSLANSAGICLGPDYSFDLVRPGLALYGGVPRPEADGNIRQVARVEAQIVQRRTVRAGESCGYGAAFAASVSATATFAASPPEERHLPANSRYRYWAGFRWTWSLWGATPPRISRKAIGSSSITICRPPRKPPASASTSF